jgi:hypothetical protein
MSSFLADHIVEKIIIMALMKKQESSIFSWPYCRYVTEQTRLLNELMFMQMF